MSQSDDGVSVARMYSIYEVLNGAKEKSLVVDEYLELLTCVDKTDKEKRLAGPFITRFIECFPELIVKSMDALVSLCESDNDSVRKQVIKDLATVCGKLPSMVSEVADIYAQLMITDDNGELGIIHSSLVRLFGMDAEGTIKGLFWAVRKSENENQIVVERCLTFLASKLKKMECVTVNVERALLVELKQVVGLFCDEDFARMMDVISATKIFDTHGGRQSVLDIIVEVMKPDDDFDGTLEENIHKFLTCGEQILKIISFGETCPGPFVIYCCTKVIPNLRDCLCHEDGDAKQFEMLKIMAEATLHLKKSFDKDNATKCLEAIYVHILDLLPLPSQTGSQDDSVHNYKYSVIECYVFMLYKLCWRKPEYLDGNKEKLLDLRTRLQLFARVLMGYIKILKKDISDNDGATLKTRDKDIKEKECYLKLANNIYVIVKDFFRTPILCELKVGPSWLPVPSSLERRKRNFETQVGPSNRGTERKLKYPKNVLSPNRGMASSLDDRPRRVISPPRFQSPQDYRGNLYRRGHGQGYRPRIAYAYNRRKRPY